MGFPDLFKRATTGMGLDELARRLHISESELAAVPIQYQQFEIPKRGRNAGRRTILAPALPLKVVQRRCAR